MLFRKHLSADHSDRGQRLKLQYQAMIQQGIMSVVGIVLMVMGFQEGIVRISVGDDGGTAALLVLSFVSRGF